MAKKKVKKKKKRASTYEKKLAVNAEFIDVIKVAMNVDKKKK